MLTNQNPVLEDMVMTMHEMSTKDESRGQYQAREDYYRTLNTLKAHIDNRDQIIKQKSVPAAKNCTSERNSNREKASFLNGIQNLYSSKIASCPRSRSC